MNDDETANLLAELPSLLDDASTSNRTCICTTQYSGKTQRHGQLLTSSPQTPQQQNERRRPKQNNINNIEDKPETEHKTNPGSFFRPGVSCLDMVIAMFEDKAAAAAAGGR